MITAIEPPRNVNPCIPSPCGPNSECRELDARAVCSCSFGMLGAPPNCRPECVIHQECPSNRACIAQQCQDPCIGSCGFNARCTTQNHQPICSCIEGFEGDPYASCTPSQSKYKLFNYTIDCKFFETKKNQKNRGKKQSCFIFIIKFLLFFIFVTQFSYLAATKKYFIFYFITLHIFISKFIYLNIKLL